MLRQTVMHMLRMSQYVLKWQPHALKWQWLICLLLCPFPVSCRPGWVKAALCPSQALFLAPNQQGGVIAGRVRCHHVRGANGSAPSASACCHTRLGDWDSITAGFHTPLVTKLMGAPAARGSAVAWWRWDGEGERRRSGNEKKRGEMWQRGRWREEKRKEGGIEGWREGSIV